MRTMAFGLAALAVAIMAAVTIAEAVGAETFTFNFQGKLSNALGEPVPDGNYQVRLLIYTDSIGGTPLWNELHPTVPLAGGFFSIDAGSIVPCSLAIPSLENIYLATQIGTEPPMARRLKISSAPNSGVARRIYGDLETGAGRLLLRSAEGDSTFRLSSVDGLNMFQIGAVVPPDPWAPAIEMKTDAAAQISSIRLSSPPDPWAPAIEMSTGASGEGSFVMFNPQSEPPGSDPLKLFEVSTRTGEGTGIKLYNPRTTEPIDDGKVFEVVNNSLGGASLKMFNPQPEPPGNDPWITMEVSSSGPDLRLFAPQVGGATLANGHPQIRLSSDLGSSRLLMQRAFTSGTINDSIGFLFHADSVRSYLVAYKGGLTDLKFGNTADGGYASFFSDGSEYMGIEPSPWRTGGDLIMKGTGGVQTMVLGSDGTISMFDNGTEYMGVDPVPWHAGGDLTMYDGGVQTMVFGSNGAMSMLDDGSEYMGIEPSPWHTGGDLTMYDATGGPTLLLASSGMASIGTGNHTNILTIRQFSSTDPIADAWTTYSSRRWKTNIRPLEGSLAKVMKLQGVSYDQKEGGQHDIGLIAEDVGQVVPEVVAYEDNGVDAKSVDYARLVTLLIEGMKEQQAKISSLESRIEELEKQ